MEIHPETDDTLSVTLGDLSGAPLHFEPGQFFTVLIDLEGTTFRRAYSASNTMATAVPSGSVRVTVKRVEGGRVSSHIHKHLREGDTLRVFGPSGAFTLSDSTGQSFTGPLVLIAGGSGITPLMSLASAALDRPSARRVVLIDGNRSLHDVIFRDELAAMGLRHPERFVLRQFLSSPPAHWTGGVGRLDEDTLRAELGRRFSSQELMAADFYVCGPEAMMRAARRVLRALGVGEESLHEERFSQPHLRPVTVQSLVTSSETHRLTLRRALSVIETEVSSGDTLLESALRAGAELSFSCTMGGCGACKMKLCEGEVSMEEPNCLSTQEREEGYILTCVSRPLSAITLHDTQGAP